jgi:hypothetical protein
MKLLEAESYTFKTFWRNLKLSHKRDSCLISKDLE